MNSNPDPLLFVAATGDVRAIQEVLTSGANINALNDKGYSALSFAIMGGHVDAVKALVVAGAELKCPSNPRLDALTLARSAINMDARFKSTKVSHERRNAIIEFLEA